MATTLRPISHEDQLSLVDHLDELRHRLIICVIAVGITFALCFWQSDLVLEIVNQPIETTQRLDGSGKTADPLEQTARFQRELGQQLRSLAPALGSAAAATAASAASDDLSVTERRELRALSRELIEAQKQTTQAARATPTNLARKPVTLGVAEPFTATISVAFYAGLLLALPIVLYQLFAFLLPAFTPRERTLAVPLMFLGPVLFISGVLFAYFVVLTRAVEFLQNFNDDNFDILLQAKDYYRFSVMFMAAIGLMFQIPLVVLAITRLGIMTSPATAEEPRIRAPRRRRPGGRRDPHAGPRDHAPVDGAARRAVRAEYSPCSLAQPDPAARCGRRRSRAGRRRRIRRSVPCSLTCAPVVAGASYRWCTSSSPFFSAAVSCCSASVATSPAACSTHSARTARRTTPRSSSSSASTTRRRSSRPTRRTLPRWPSRPSSTTRSPVPGRTSTASRAASRRRARGAARRRARVGHATWRRIRKKLNTGVAIQMVQVFSTAGLNKPDKAVDAMELYIAERPGVVEPLRPARAARVHRRSGAGRATSRPTRRWRSPRRTTARSCASSSTT